MNKATELQNTLMELFLNAADTEDEEQYLTGLLDELDYEAILQGMNNDAGPIYQFHAFSDDMKNMEYYGPVLFPFGAVLIYEQITDVTDHDVTCSRALELWLLPDMSFAVTSRFALETEDDSYETIYRTYKGDDWQEAGMYIEFEELAENLQALCMDPVEEGMALYEL